MQKIFSKQRFEPDKVISFPGKVLKDYTFDRCVFASGIFGLHHHFTKWTVIRNTSFIKCTVSAGCVLDQTAIEDCLVEDTTVRHGRLIAKGCVFKHVKIKGIFTGGALLASSYCYTEIDKITHIYKECIVAEKKYYKKVDWAIDISEMVSKDFEIIGVPVDLIRRNPELQVIVRKENVPIDYADKLKDKVDSIILLHLNRLFNAYRPLNEIIIIASQQSKYFKEYIAGIKVLRKLGIADKD
jgi:hypothetical protein